jgi:hypothetical protein
MKSLILIVLMSVSFLSSRAQGSLDAISKALGTGDAATLSNYFDQNVEVCVLDSEEVYPKTQAIQIVRDFFGKNKPKSYAQVHQGASTGKASQYTIGKLTTATGVFRVYVYLKVSGSSTLIQEIRFDKE